MDGFSSVASEEREVGEPSVDSERILPYKLKDSNINLAVQEGFYGLGRFCAKFPYFTLTCTAIIIGVTSLGWAWFAVETDPVKLWVGKDSFTAKEKKTFDESFGPFYRTQQVIIHSTDEMPVIRRDIILEVFTLLEDVKAIRTEEGTSFNDLCTKPTGTACVVQSVSEYWSSKEAFDTDDWSDEFEQCVGDPVQCLPAFQQPIKPELILGGYEEDDYKTAKAVIITLVLDNSIDDEKKALSSMWEVKLLDLFEAKAKDIASKFDNDGVLRGFLKKVYAPYLMNQEVKYAILTGFLGLFFISLALTKGVELGLNQREAVPRDSYLVEYFNDLDEYFGVGPPVYFVATDFNASKREVQKALCGRFPGEGRELCQPTEDDDDCELCYSPGSWNYSMEGFPEGAHFGTYVKWFLESVPSQECPLGGAAAYSNAILLEDGVGGGMKAAHFRTYHTPLKSQRDLIGAYRSARRIASDITERTGISVFPYSIFYVFFEQYTSIVNQAVTVVVLALIPIFVITTTFLAFRSAVIVVTTTLMILVDLLGVMSLWGISLNALSTVNLVICVGISVEFLSHITRSYTVKTGSRDQRAYEALVEMGGSIFSGITLTKFVGVSILYFAKSRIFEIYYFRILFGDETVLTEIDDLYIMSQESLGGISGPSANDGDGPLSFVRGRRIHRDRQLRRVVDPRAWTRRRRRPRQAVDPERARLIDTLDDDDEEEEGFVEGNDEGEVGSGSPEEASDRDAGIFDDVLYDDEDLIQRNSEATSTVPPSIPPPQVEPRGQKFGFNFMARFGGSREDITDSSGKRSVRFGGSAVGAAVSAVKSKRRGSGGVKYVRMDEDDDDDELVAEPQSYASPSALFDENPSLRQSRVTDSTLLKDPLTGEIVDDITPHHTNPPRPTSRASTLSKRASLTSSASGTVDPLTAAALDADEDDFEPLGGSALSRETGTDLKGKRQMSLNDL
ncbi:hypothetical protein HDU96_005161 [Phlyctochytrium bullatum]|nr:hypothetical protein HDU96_005161 [Phlyctochytrium bullatum]